MAVDGLPPWESDRETSYFGDASDRRFIREIFPFALSSLSLKREEITESLRVSCLLSPRLLISTFRGLNIAPCTFCGLRTGKKKEICIFYVFYFYASRTRSSFSSRGNREGYKNLEGMKSDNGSRSMERMDGS